MLAEAVRSPLRVAVPLADDPDFAVRIVATQGANLQSRREKQWQCLCRLLSSLKAMHQQFNARRCESSHRVSAHLFPANIEALLLSVAWPDTGAAIALCEGVQIVGPLPSFGIYRSAPSLGESSASCFSVKDNLVWLQDILRRRPPPPAKVQVVWDKSEKERSLVLEGWFEPEELHHRFGFGRWRPMIRFAIWQGNHGAYRCIDCKI